MWKIGESSSRPPAVDDTSSQKYVYVYRNIEEKTRERDGVESETYFAYEYAKLEKEIYEYVKELWETENRTSGIEEVLAEMLFGGEE